MNYTAQVGELVHNLNILASHRDRANSSIQEVAECLDLRLDPGDTLSQRFSLLAQCLEGLCEDINGLSKDHSVVSKVEISDLNLAKRRTASRALHHFPHNPIHTSAEK